MSENQEKGKLGEDAACAELIKRGHTILARNYRRRSGELDIVSGVGQNLVITEVKTRKRGAMVSGAEAVTFAKKRRLILTTDAYVSDDPGILKKFPYIRYDIAEVVITRGTLPRVISVEIIEDAFDTEGVETVY